MIIDYFIDLFEDVSTQYDTDLVDIPMSEEDLLDLAILEWIANDMVEGE